MAKKEIRFTKVGAKSYDDYDEWGECSDGWETKRLGWDDFFSDAVRVLVRQELNMAGLEDAHLHTSRVILLTTRQRWSGYSEYTVTSSWQEIIVTIPDLNWERMWQDVGTFISAVSDANPMGH